jgi:hypothetical protein
MTQYPEHEKLHAVKDKSQAIGEFLEWLGGRYVFANYRKDSEWLRPENLNIQRELAEYFEIDLDKIEEEKQAILAEVRKAQQPLALVEEPKNWYFTFGHGQPHFGYYHVIHGTCAETSAEMTRRFGGVWSMQYASREAAGVDEWSLKELK